MDGNSSQEDQQCYFLTFNTSKIDQVSHVYLIAGIFDGILILPTITLNILLIVSLYRSSEIRKPPTKLLFSLALSDLLVGLLVEPALLAKKIAEIKHDFTIYCKTGLITYVFGGALTCVSFYTLTAIAIDRYLIIHKGTKYRSLITNKKVCVVVLILWMMAFAMMTAQLYLPRSGYFKGATAISVTCVAIASACYLKCFATLKSQQKLIGKFHEGNSVSSQSIRNNHNYNKSMRTMSCVFLAFNLCWLPFICTSISALFVGESAIIWGAESIASVFIYCNSVINPIILLVRMKEIRRVTISIISIKKSHDLVSGRKRRQSVAKGQVLVQFQTLGVLKMKGIAA